MRVVLDAGHGGRDPGAVGRGGLQEKQVNLAVALALEKKLTRRGWTVVLTRASDVTLL
ncbi:MAG: N-acetylmuramoyl-L-alanine amidase, partial [Clostridia bacterium]|nr:N-acetylmuramoyl-L-alanine amidase [Clostridia bacterium]